MKDDFLLVKLEERRQQHALRQLKLPEGKIDFCSNDYLGIARNDLIERRLLHQHQNTGRNTAGLKSGSTGSRLLAGNYPLIEEVEKQLAGFHESAAGLIYNSGYDANTGLLSAVPQRGDTVIFDQLSHASIRDGIRLSFATSFSFPHNDLQQLEEKLLSAAGRKFVVTESVFSMDGDQAPLQPVTDLCEKHDALLILDEAHATGVIGKRGEGLAQSLGLHTRCFARIHTFGKACGAHGAIILGSMNLRNYLINFSRPFIYTTALPETSVSAIRVSYEIFPELINERKHLARLIDRFRSAELTYKKLDSITPVQVVIIPGNEAVRTVAQHLQDNNLDVRAILYPSVPRGQERLRIVIHAFNTEDELSTLIRCLK